MLAPGYTWHGSLPRSQDGHRVAAHLTMIRARPRPLQDFTIRDGMEDLAAGTTQPEAMRVLLAHLDVALGAQVIVGARVAVITDGRGDHVAAIVT